MRGTGEQNLASRGKTLGILDAGQGPGSVADAIEDYLGRGAGKGCLDARESLAHELHAVVVLELLVKEEEVAWCVNSQRGEGNRNLDTFREFFFGQDSELGGKRQPGCQETKTM